MLIKAQTCVTAANSQARDLPVVEKLVPVSRYRYAVPARGHARERHGSFQLSAE